MVRVGVQIRPGVANENDFSVEIVLGVELSVSISELAYLGRNDLAVLGGWKRISSASPAKRLRHPLCLTIET